MTGITLSPSQELAKNGFRQFLRDDTQQEFLLAGFAGSGKTFLVKYLIQLARDEFKSLKLIHPAAQPRRFIYTATTNKAASVLSTMIDEGESAATIHSTLGLQVRNNYKTGHTTLVAKPGKCASLHNSVLVIDEASMINRELLEMIQKQARKVPTCKILYVGDSYQLPPIRESTCPIFTGSGNVFHLTDIQRQAAESPIINFSHKYREMIDDPEREWPEMPTGIPDITFHTDGEKWKQAIADAYATPHSGDDLRVLGWTNQRMRMYNSWIRSHLGFEGAFSIGETLLSNNPIIFGDRVRARTDSLHVVQDFDLQTRNGVPGHKLRLMPVPTGSDSDGEPLHVFQPTDWAHTRRVLASLAKAKDWNTFFQIKNEWADLRPMYAQTVHKAQGSTYRDVFIDVGDIGANNKWYEVARLMYVAITRASRSVHLFGKLEARYDTDKNPMKILEAFADGTFETP